MKKTLPSKALLTAVALFLAACAPCVVAVAEPGFVADTALPYTYLSADDTPAALSFFVYSKEGVLSGVNVRVREIRDPLGQALDATALEVTQEADVVTPAGMRVTLKPKESGLLRRAGEYRLTLLLEGRAAGRTPLQSLTTLLVKRPAAELNLEEIKGQTIELTRSFPWCKADGNTFHLPLDGISGGAAIAAPEVYPQGVYVKDSKVLTEGKLEAVPRLEVEGEAGKETRRWVLDLKPSEMASAGSFSSLLRVRSVSFAEDKVIPLQLTVTDWWPSPLFVICVGVFGGFVVNFVAASWKPRQLNRERVVKFRGELDRYGRDVSKPAKLIRLQEIARSLNEAEGRNDGGDAPGAKSRLDLVAADLDAFRKEEVAEQAALYTAVSALKARVNLYRHSLADLTPEEQASLSAIARRLESGDLEMHLSNGRVDETSGMLETLGAEFDDFRKERLRKDLTSLGERLRLLGQIPEVHEFEKTSIEEMLGRARRTIEAGEVDKARGELDEVNKAIRALGKKLQKGLADNQSPRFQLPGAAEEAGADERLHVVVLEHPLIWTTGTNLNFMLKDPRGELRADDRFRWDFNEGPPVDSASPRAPHRFTAEGHYVVKVEVLRGAEAAVFAAPFHPLTVLPGRTEVALRQSRRSIRRVEVVLLVVALIVASLSGLLYLYVGKQFGSAQDYLLALLWGFGVDSSVRGFAGVLQKVSGKEA